MCGSSIVIVIVIVIVHNRPTSQTVANHLWLIRNIFHRPDFAKVTKEIMYAII